MAGEIAQDVAVTLTLIGAAMGAGGAIASQVITGVITDRREQRKSREEAERWKLEADAKRRDRQFDRKLEVFSKFLSTAKTIADIYRRSDKLVYEEWTKEFKGPFKQLQELAEEIGILAPELFDVAGLVTKRASEVDFLAFMHDLSSEYPGKGDPERGNALKTMAEVRNDLWLWAGLFRDSARCYVSHKPIPSVTELQERYREMTSTRLPDAEAPEVG